MTQKNDIYQERCVSYCIFIALEWESNLRNNCFVQQAENKTI